MLERELWPHSLRTPDGLGSSSNSDENSERISYSQVRNETIGGTAILQKFNRPGEFERAVHRQLTQVPSDIKEMLCSEKTYLPSRIKTHILRLLSREGVEYDFAVAMLKHAPPVLREQQDAERRSVDVLGAETTDTMMWWTFGPYLYKELISSGIEEKAALEMVLNWATNSPVAEGGSSQEINVAFNLRGLEIFKEEHLPRYTLARKKEDLSHRFTAQEAKRIVRDVFGIEEKKK